LSFRYNSVFFLLLLLFSLPGTLRAQVMNPNTLDPTAQQNNMFNQGKDSSIMKSATNWKDEQAKIYYNYLNSAVARYPDSSLNRFHRYQPVQPWWGKDLGNYGTAVRNQFFTPATAPGLSLGYHIYDMYRLHLDSLAFYNTTRPYSSFSFMLGSKSEQHVEILHTQNITPGWNFAAKVRYITSQGFYLRQKANGISGSFSTNYQSKNQRYYMAAGFIYNRNKQEENGGILADSFLTSSDYADRERIPVKLPPVTIGSTTAAVTNILRQYDFYLQNNYSFGNTDTLYTKDSTGITYQFTPRFRIKHQLQLHSERHIYRDMGSDAVADSIRYQFIDTFRLRSSDSIYGVQDWFYVDNKFSLNGFLGKKKELVQIEAGIANRVDQFSTSYVSDRDRLSSVSNYIFGEIKKEAFAPKQWSYLVSGAFFFTGDATGNFDVNGTAGKDLGKWGMLSAGFRQTLSNAPYAYNTFRTNFYERSYTFGKTSTTKIWGAVSIDELKLQLGIRNYLITNYLYYNENIVPVQEKDPFSILQIYGRKEFRFRVFSLDNEVVWQQPTGNAPVHLPAVLLRHKLAVESYMFKKALKVALGVEIRYHTPYYSDGYTPYFNQFYYQSTYKLSNAPECSAFFNFKIRNFRAFVLGDQLQQFFTTNIMNAPGYPAQNALFRFGFNWILIN
jgi:hypothetical protein